MNPNNRKTTAFSFATTTTFAAGLLLLGSSNRLEAQSTSTSLTAINPCARKISDFSSPGNCIAASSIPLPGMLLPLGNHFFVDGAGNVGIGTTAPQQKLDVVGSVRVIGGGNGVVFPDGSMQTSAVTGGGGGVPAGFMILGETSVAPSGFTAAGSLAVSESWVIKTPAPSYRTSFGAVRLDNDILLIGGSSNSYAVGTVEAYQTQTDSWTTVPSLNVPRMNLGAVEIGGIVYAIGGYDPNIGLLNTCEAYDPQVGSWVVKSPMHLPRNVYGAAAANGRVHVFGGDPDGLTESWEEYDPGTDTWINHGAITTIPYGGPAIHSAVAFGNKIYVFGAGSCSSPPCQFGLVLDVVSGSWTGNAYPIPVAMPSYDWSAVASQGKIFFAGGGPFLTLFQSLNPTTQTWASEKSLLVTSNQPRVVAVGSKIYSFASSLGATVTTEYSPAQSLFLFSKN